MGRLGDPHELVGALLFLAGETSSFVTGHTMVVDGGLSASTSSGTPPEVRAIFAEALPDGLGKPILPQARS